MRPTSETGVINAYKSGKATSEIAAECGCHKSSVLRVLHKHGLTILITRRPSNYAPHNKTSINNVSIIDLHKIGWSAPQIAKQLNCSAVLIRGRIRSLGLPFNKVHFAMAPNLIAMIGQRAYDRLSDRAWLYRHYIVQGKPTRQIAKEVGCGKKAVSTFLRRHGLPIKRARRGTFKSKYHKCKLFWYDSWWEYLVAVRLDNDSMVTKFIKEPFPIQYIDQHGKSREYFPDFSVWLTTGEMYLLEIKPDGLLPYVEKKTAAAVASGFKFVVLNDVDYFPWEKHKDTSSRWS